MRIRLRVVDHQGEEHEVNATSGETLMQPLRELPYGVMAVCGGLCTCATCHVYIDEPWFEQLPPLRMDEEALLEGMLFREATSRLSCQLMLTAQMDGMKLTLAPEE